MAKPKLNGGERVRNEETGVVATFVGTSTAKGRGVAGGRAMVLLDDGPKTLTYWPKDVPLALVGGRRRSNCDRCGGKGHMAFDCLAEAT